MNRAMTGRLWLCAALTVLSASCLVTVISGIGTVEAGAATPAPDAITEVETGFLLRSCDGCIAIFGPGDDKPVAVTDIELVSLREADRELIERGLAVESREKLMMLLEDLGS